GGIIDRISIEPDAALGGFDATALGHAEIGALADHLALDLAAGDANGVVGTIAGGFVALVRRAAISADAAEEQRIGRRFEDGFHQLLRGHGLTDTEELASFRAQLDLFRGPRIDATAFGNQALVVVLPARPRQREHPLALGKALLRIGIRIDEDIAM